MDKLIEEFLAGREFVLAGASANPEKYGNIILKQMLARGYRVIPVNPREESIEGLPCFPSITALPTDASYVDFVLPAPRTREMIPDLVARNCRIAWLQPGADSPELIAELEAAGIRVIADGNCIMVAAAQRR